MNLADKVRDLLPRSSRKEETELVTDIQDRKPENLRLEETNMTPVEVKEKGGAA